MYSQIDSNRRKSWLIILLFIGFIAIVVYFYGVVSGDDPLISFTFAFVLSLVMSLVSWFAGDAIALSSTGAQELKQRETFPTLWSIVENLALTAGIPRPRIYIIEDDAPNAFATGRDPAHASIAVTTGLLARLEKVELEGVIAHELSHIQNYDIRVMTIVIVLAGTVVLLGDLFFRFGGFGRSRRNSDRGGNSIGLPFLLIGFAILLLSPLIAEAIKLAVSRKREYLADASGSLLTRYPEGLARALEKISQANIPMQRSSSATNHLWISAPKTGGLNQKIASLFSTHPPIEDRIKQLRRMGA